jgi:hypothetical protein
MIVDLNCLDYFTFSRLGTVDTSLDRIENFLSLNHFDIIKNNQKNIIINFEDKPKEFIANFIIK